MCHLHESPRGGRGAGGGERQPWDRGDLAGGVLDAGAAGGRGGDRRLLQPEEWNKTIKGRIDRIVDAGFQNLTPSFKNKNRLCSMTCDIGKIFKQKEKSLYNTVGSKGSHPRENYGRIDPVWSRIRKQSNGSHPEEKSGHGATDPTPKKIMGGRWRVKVEMTQTCLTHNNKNNSHLSRTWRLRRR